jgi:hypothetical protein
MMPLLKKNCVLRVEIVVKIRLVIAGSWLVVVAQMFAVASVEGTVAETMSRAL